MWFIKTGKPRTDIRTDCDFSPSTVAKIWNDRFPVRSDVIETICKTYGLRIEEVIEYREMDKG
ncbi:helix-turn-helix domain-containing protein [Brevibacillus agri]|uniref:helix-turn-helix domain-containing protein n=1 Tax=Brevibacillus agri TaxID=51101 RepID=UPI002867BFDE|nr:helix-turn-helix transcriptional regulator [Brevibacillus agri]